MLGAHQQARGSPTTQSTTILEIKVVVSSPRNGGLTKEDNLVSSSHGVECRRQEDL